ncbi:MAG: FtsQ-type POTRA domain-containing protein [Clostridia bacterium]|nr:FtsQ-type POTRA domain-containing protein [Clostridia bacterium]
MKAQKKKFRRALNWIKFILTVVLAVSAIAALFFSPLFDIKHITMTESKHYSREQILEATSLSAGTNGFVSLIKNAGGITNALRLLSFRHALAEDAILNGFPYVKTAAVRFNPPNAVKIDITEREAVALVPYMGSNLIVDADGYVLDINHKAQAEPLPVIKGLAFEGYKMGQALKLDNPEAFASAKTLMNTIKDADEADKQKLWGLVNSIDASSPDATYMNVDSRIMVNLGNITGLSYDSLLYRIRFFKQIFIKNLKKDDKGLVNFTMGENPKFIPQH